MKLLLIEDDIRIIEFLARGLRAEGHTVTVEADGPSGLNSARGEEWDAIILDLMLPGLDGREVCRTLRAEKNNTAILMLTALDSTDEIVGGLRMGADDYLTKPFAFDELLARLENLKGRGNTSNVGGEKKALQVADLTFDRDALIVTRGGREIELTSLEYALLEFLMTESGKVVSRAHILQNVWGSSTDPLTNIVDVYVRRLRSKIDDGAETKLISTIRGRGYRLSG